MPKKTTALRKNRRPVAFHDPLRPGGPQDDVHFINRTRRRFETEQQYQHHLESLPQIEHQPDPKAAHVPMSLWLPQRVIEGYQRLAEAHSIRDGQTLMKMVLQNYLNAYLEGAFPEESRKSAALGLTNALASGRK